MILISAYGLEYRQGPLLGGRSFIESFGVLRTSLLKRRPVINWCVEINAPRAVDFNAPRRVEINRAAVMDQKNIRNTIESIKFPMARVRTQGCGRFAPAPMVVCEICSMHFLTFWLKCCEHAGHTQISLHPMWRTSRQRSVIVWRSLHHTTKKFSFFHFFFFFFCLFPPCSC